jgi:endonuclease/exonuclease/phosphatase family metal-dependent hydrolase
MRLITWNIQSCRGCDGVVSPQRIVSDARAFADFDVLCVQEVAAGFPAIPGSSGEDQFAELSALLPGYTLVPGVAVDTPRPDGTRARYGNAIFSRLPVLQVSVTRLPRPSDPQARRSMPRCVLEAVIKTALGPVRVMTTHLEFHSAPQRAAQVDALLGLHAEHALRAIEGQMPDTSGGPFTTWPEPEHALLVGDFNFPATDPLYARMTGAHRSRVPPLADAWVHANPGEPCPPTVGLYDHVQWPRPFACDFIFASRPLLEHVRRVAVDGRTSASDHQPVLVELAAA